MDISHTPLSADKAGRMITNHTNIQTKAALWDSLIAIQIHTHDPITRDYTKQLQLHANIPNWYSQSRRMLCMKERFKKIGRYMYKVGLFPGLSTVQFTTGQWDHLGTRVVMEYELLLNWIATKLLASKPGFSSHIAALETRCSISSFRLAALEEFQKLQDITGHQWDHKTSHTFFLSTTPKPQTQITGGVWLNSRCIHGQKTLW